MYRMEMRAGVVGVKVGWVEGKRVWLSEAGRRNPVGRGCSVPGLVSVHILEVMLT